VGDRVNQNPGEPADNAAYFVKWLSNLQGETLSNLRYAVFGCGNRDWVQTYQRIPRLVDELLGKHGGKPLLSRAEGDAGGSEIFNDFDNWEALLFETLAKVISFCIRPTLKLIFPPPRNTTRNPPPAPRVSKSRRRQPAPLGRRRCVRKTPLSVK
jgi:sulfite reductase alpha subunit-like flavoprotein